MSPIKKTENQTQTSKTATRMVEIAIDQGSTGSLRGDSPEKYEKFEVPAKRKKQKGKGNKLTPVGITGRAVRNSASRPSLFQEEN